MANFRPAGLSDEDTDSDDYGFYEKPNRKQLYSTALENTRQKTETKLQDAIINSDLEGTAKIIRNELEDNVNAKLESGWAPLLHACFHAHETIVHFLLEKGADPNMHADSATPVMLACSNSSANEDVTYTIVSDLIQKGAFLNIGDKYGVTPLMRATISGRASVVELILEKDGSNIEMRDRQGWTAVFWAIHHNQPHCLELLLKKGARFNIVDKSDRSPEQIANSHDYNEIIYILEEHARSSYDDKLPDKTNTSEESDGLSNLTLWQDYYPGLRDESKPIYAKEIPHLLYGMNCDRLSNIFKNTPMDLRTFLLLENEEMLKLGIKMPFERNRLIHGLHEFHTRKWKSTAVAGLLSRKCDPYSIVECLSMLGNHLQQLYVLESTLAYVLRDFNRIQNKIKFEPPDSPTIDRLLSSAKTIVRNVNNLRKEMNATKKIYTEINKNSFKPADLITEKETKHVALEVLTQLVVFGSLSYIAYRAINILNK